MEKYISLDKIGYRFYFEDPVVSEDDLKQIKPLTTEYSTKLWTRFGISNERHLALRYGKDDWISKLDLLYTNLIDDWNADNAKGIADFLRENCPISESDTIIFFMMKECSVETTWGVFLRNWINFLYEDEAPLVFYEHSGFALFFTSDGSIYTGYKND